MGKKDNFYFLIYVHLKWLTLKGEKNPWNGKEKVQVFTLENSTPSLDFPLAAFACDLLFQPFFCYPHKVLWRVKRHKKRVVWMCIDDQERSDDSPDSFSWHKKPLYVVFLHVSMTRNTECPPCQCSKFKKVRKEHLSSVRIGGVGFCWSVCSPQINCQAPSHILQI